MSKLRLFQTADGAPDRLGATAAAQVLWSGPRLICVAGDYTRYDVHAVRERTAEPAAAADEVLLGLGDGVTKVQRKQDSAYRRLRNFASVCPPQRTKVHVYLSLDPAGVDLVPDFTRNVTGLGHHGTGDLEVRLRTERDLEHAQALFRAGYAAA